MNMMIRIAEQFSEFPGGRYPRDGKGNGTDFREKFLVPVLREESTATVVLDGTRGYPSSFLEEAFGGLIRKGYDSGKVKAAFKFVADEPGFSRYIGLIEDHINRASKAAASA